MRTATATRQLVFVGVLVAAAVAVTVASALANFGLPEPIITAPGPVTGLFAIPDAHI